MPFIYRLGKCRTWNCQCVAMDTPGMQSLSRRLAAHGDLDVLTTLSFLKQ